MAKNSLKQAERIAKEFSSKTKSKTTNTRIKAPTKSKGITKTSGKSIPKTSTGSSSSTGGGNSQTIKQTVKAVKDLAKQNKVRAERRQYNDFKKNHSEYKDITFENWKKLKSQVVSSNKRKSDTSKTKIKRFTKALQNDKIAETIDRRYKRALKEKDKYSVKASTQIGGFDDEEVKKDILNDIISTNSKKSISSRIKEAVLDEYTELGSGRMNQAKNLAAKIKQIIDEADPEELDELLKDYQNLTEKEITEELKKKSAAGYQKMLGIFNSTEEVMAVMHYDEQYASYSDYMAAYRASHRR